MSYGAPSGIEYTPRRPAPDERRVGIEEREKESAPYTLDGHRAGYEEEERVCRARDFSARTEVIAVFKLLECRGFFFCVQKWPVTWV